MPSFAVGRRHPEGYSTPAAIAVNPRRRPAPAPGRVVRWDQLFHSTPGIKGIHSWPPNGRKYVPVDPRRPLNPRTQPPVQPKNPKNPQKKPHRTLPGFERTTRPPPGRSSNRTSSVRRDRSCLPTQPRTSGRLRRVSVVDRRRRGADFQPTLIHGTIDFPPRVLFAA